MKYKKATRKAIAAMSILVVLVLCTALLSGALLTSCTVSAAASPSEHTPTAAEPAQPFVNDPDALGTWVYIATVKNFDNFNPANTSNHKSGYEMVFAQNGDVNMPASTWSKGAIQSHSADMTINYEINTIDGAKYMFCSLIIDGVSVKHDILKWSSASTAFDMIVDNVDLPFVDDPAVIGTWKSVDYVSAITQFSPDKRLWAGDLALTEMIFQSGGGTVRSWMDGSSGNWSGHTWTAGVVLDRYMMTASTYEIKEIDGSTYLFYHWKNGDYNYRQEIWGYYVLEKTS